MPYEPTIPESSELGVPIRLPDQNAVLVGRVTQSDHEFSGLVAYYLHGRANVFLGRYESGEFVPTYVVECNRRLPSACSRAFQTLEYETELSSIGEAFVQAWHFAELTPLSDQQAHVYALREKAGFSRIETAEILNIEPNTVDTHYQRALASRESAQYFVQLDRADADEITESVVDTWGIDEDVDDPDNRVRPS